MPGEHGITEPPQSTALGRVLMHMRDFKLSAHCTMVI